MHRELRPFVCRSLARTALCCLIGAAFAGAMRANPIGGPRLEEAPGLVLVWPTYLLAEAIIVLVEALAYRIAARVEWSAALGASFVANVASAILGLLVSRLWPGALSGETNGSTAFGVALAIAVELPIVLVWYRCVSHFEPPAQARRRVIRNIRAEERTTMRRLAAAVAAANVVTYLAVDAALGISVWLMRHIGA